MIEKENINSGPFMVQIIAPYNKAAREAVFVLLEETTGPMVFSGIEVVEDASLVDCTIVIDDRPKEVAKFAEKGQVVLVTAQPRNKQGLNTYIRECKQKSGSNWENVQVVNIDSAYEGKFVQKWWDLNVAIFALAG